MNIVIGTHGRFGEELVRSAEMIVGKMENVHVVSLLPELSFEDFMREADATLAPLEGQTLVFVDLFGGTPSNVFSALSRKYDYDVITGVNLPTLIDIYLKTSNGEVFERKELVETVLNTLKESGVHTNELL